MKLDIIVPVLNEEGNVKNIYEKIKQELNNIKYNLIFIDDGSTDKTLNILKKIYENDNECIKIISFSKNFGKDAAIYAGLTYSTADYVCIIDGDLQQDPSYLTKMYNFLNEHKEYDSICMCQKQNKKRFLQTQFYKIMGKMSDMNIVNGASDFRMFNKNMAKSIIKLTEKNRFSKGIFDYVGFNTYYDEYKVKERNSGNSKWGTKKLLNYAFNGIVAFSSKPLHFATYTGIITSLIAFIYLLILLIKTLIMGIDVPGYASIMCVMLFLGGIQLVFLGIIGEYIGKTYNEVKNRPIYIEKEKIGFDEDYL